MSTKSTTRDEVIISNKIILKSVYEKANIKYYIQPCKDKYGQFPPCIKKVNAQGDMIMSEKERNDWSEGRVVFFPENHIFIVTSGKVYDLDDLYDKAEWEAIKNCPLIAKSRDERDSQGNLIIDGPISTPKSPAKNGVAELYIDRPGIETQRRISKKQFIHKACSYIYDDPNGLDGYLTKVKLLGKDMRNQPAADVMDYLISIAEQNPKKIIDLYSGTDTNLRLLLIDALEKKVIYIKDKLYLYGDNISLGATTDSVIAWMKEPRNLKVLELIKKDTYPGLYPESEK